MPRSFGSLKSWDVFVTPTGRKYKKTTKSGAACRLDDEAVLDYFAENDVVLSEVEFEALQNPQPTPAPEPAAPENPPAPPDEATESPAAPVDASEFDAAPPAPEPAAPQKSPKKK